MSITIMKRIGIIVTIGFIIFAMIFIVSMSLTGARDLNIIDVDRKEGDIGGIFIRYENQVYASVPSSGYFLIKKADASSFKLLDDHYQNRQFAVDKNYAYCGNLIIKDFNPLTAKAIGNNYFSDGKQTCYCASISEKNGKLSIISELSQRMLYGLGLGDKPQTYIYPLLELESDKTPYRAILNTEIATNGTLTYYKGKILPQASSEYLRQLPELYNDGDIRESNRYLADGEQVYYKNTKLPLKDYSDLYSIVIDAQNQDNYLIDPEEGMVYVNDISFKSKYSPYRALSLNGGHVYHSLFLSKYGIFYFDKEENKVVRIKNNPFNGRKFTEIAPLIFSDGKQIIYTQTSENRGSRLNPKLKSQSTHIFRLDEPTTGTWQKIGMVNHNSGSVWKNDLNYYYFDQLGINQLISQTIYRIADQATISILLSPEIRTDEIRSLVLSDRMKKVKNIELIDVKTTYSSDYGLFIWFIIFLALGIQILLWILRKSDLKIKPFSIKNQRLKVANLLGKSYSITAIDIIIFSIEPAFLQKGYTGRFQIHTKDGMLSRKYRFASQIRLTADTKQELELYITNLQQLLKQYHIESIVK